MGTVGKQVCFPERAREHQLDTLQMFNEDEDRRHKRRELDDEQLRKLIKTTMRRDIEGGMRGKDRATLYLIAACTGYRRSELKALTPESFDLDSVPPAIEVPAAYTKAGRDDRQPIPGDVAAHPRSW